MPDERRTPLPVDAALPGLLEALRRAGAAVLTAPTGAGKTTRVPGAVLDAFPNAGQVVLIEPRRIAARAAARRIAFERGGPVGGEVGYAVRFDTCAGPRTRFLAATDGVFLRRLLADPFLEGVGAVVFDEFHERSLGLDLALAMTQALRRDARPDLLVVAMSATLHAEPLAAFLGDAPIVDSAGRLYPIATEWLGLLDAPDLRVLPGALRTGIRLALERTPGDVLAFLPGVGEIRRAAEALEPLIAEHGCMLAELYGDLPADRQDAALRPAGRRKIVLATNVAETSVTVEGVTAVVDSGLARTLRYDPSVGLDRLELGRISKAAAEQRAGRAGRTAPGHCLRLWSERLHPHLAERDEPEVRRVDLAGPLLDLACWGEPDPRAFGWFEPPPEASLERASRLLAALGALGKDGAPTGLGRSMSRLPAPLRLARLLAEGHARGIPQAAAAAAALLAERSPFWGERFRAEHVGLDDVSDRLGALHERRTRTAFGELNRAAAASIQQAEQQLRRETHALLGPAPNPAEPTDLALRRALLAAFPDRVCKRRAAGGPRGVMVGGRGVRLAEESSVAEAELFVAVEIAAGAAEDLVRQAVAIERSWLAEEGFVTETVLAFDDTRQRVAAKRLAKWRDLPLAEAELAAPEGPEAEALLAEAAAKNLAAAAPLDDPALAGFLARTRWLAAAWPESGVPGFDERDLAGLLAMLCVGKTSFAELRKAPWLAYLEGSLTQAQRQTLEREAPERLEVPSGSKIAMQYEAGRPPTIAVRVQECFGWPETPRLAGGRVPVLLHLLAPNGRPQQVTDDLKSFWNNTYQLVRKELRVRYPRHAWPEDPWNAPPERRPQRRKPG